MATVWLQCRYMTLLKAATTHATDVPAEVYVLAKRRGFLSAIKSILRLILFLAVDSIRNP